MQEVTFISSKETIAITYGSEEITYSSLLNNIYATARLWENYQCERVAIFAHNCPQWIYTFFSSWVNNTTPVPIDYLASSDEVAYILDDCRPGVVFYSDATAKTFEEALKKANNKPVTIKIDSQQLPAINQVHDTLSIHDINKTAVIIYTSGTTGNPKGVMLSFDNLLANIEAVTSYIPIYTAHRSVLLLLPLHHIFPLLGSMIAPLFVGGLVAMSPSMASEDIIQTLQKNKVAIMIGVPRLYAAIRNGIMDKIRKQKVAHALFKIVKTVGSPSFSKKIFKKVHDRFGGNVTYMVCGGAKLDENVAADFKTLGFEMLEGFGMTEAAPMITFTRPGRWKIGSAGEKMPGMEVESRDGEIVARGRNIMQGYFNKPEATAAIIKDGWLHTGDLGYFDSQGFIHITGRKKDIIVLSNGKNINPEEIEFKLKEISPIVAEAGVFMKDDKLSVAIYPDFQKVKELNISDISEEIRWNVIDLYNKNASPYKHLTKFFIQKEELPKTRLGKIQRYKLETITSPDEKKNSSATEPDFEEYVIIRDYLKEQKNVLVNPDDHLQLDLGLDSLDKISFQTFLESSFGIELHEDTFTHHPTVVRIASYMREKKKKFSHEAVRWGEILKEKIDLSLPKNMFTQNLIKNISRIGLSLYFRVKAEGRENLPDGPVIIAPNHQSFLDGLFVSIFLSNKAMRETYFYAKEKHVRNPLIRAFATRNNVVIMDINKDLKQSLQKLAALLQKGKKIMIFPEGTRSRNGELGSFKKAFAILSRELNVPIVPVSIKGAYDALPRGSIFPKPFKRIKVKFNKPVYPAGHDYNSLSDLVHRILKADLAG